MHDCTFKLKLRAKMQNLGRCPPRPNWSIHITPTTPKSTFAPDQHKNGMPKKILATALNTLVKKLTHHMQPWHLDLVLNEHLKWHLKLDRTTYLKGNHKKTSLKKSL